jgi:hypothetical protein
VHRYGLAVRAKFLPPQFQIDTAHSDRNNGDPGHEPFDVPPISVKNAELRDVPSSWVLAPGYADRRRGG